MIFLGGHLAIVDLLLDAGGENDYADLGGMTPLLHSVHQGSIITLLKYWEFHSKFVYNQTILSCIKLQ